MTYCYGSYSLLFCSGFANASGAKNPAVVDAMTRSRWARVDRLKIFDTLLAVLKIRSIEYMNETEINPPRGPYTRQPENFNTPLKSIRFDMGICEESENFARMVANLQDRAVNWHVEQDGRLIWIVFSNCSQ